MIRIRLAHRPKSCYSQFKERNDKMKLTSFIVATGILVSIFPAKSQQTSLSRAQLADFRELKTHFDVAIILARSTVPREEKVLVDSYEMTLVDLASQRGKQQRGKTTMRAVLRLVHNLLKLDLQIASTKGQQSAALLRHITLLRDIESTTDAREDRYRIQFAIALAEKELANRRAETRN